MQYTSSDILQVTASGNTDVVLPALKRTPGIDFGCRPQLSTAADGTLEVLCFIPAAAVASLEAAGVKIELKRNASADGRQRQTEVLHTLPKPLAGIATHHLTASAGVTPQLITGYLSTSLVESTMGQIAAQYPQLCQRITLPYTTVNGNTVTMLRVGKQGTTKKRGTLLTACAHAREWGGAEICLNFVMDLLAAYQASAGITYGGSTIAFAQVKTIVETVDLFVVPCVNPDGRTYSMQTNALWRKNRNGTGVDLNRNYDFVWDFETDFNPGVANDAPGSGVTFPPASTDPNNDLYHGTGPASEQEAKNIVWILDTYPTIGWLLDIHSYTGDVLFSWGDAPDQLAEPAMSFKNAAFNGKRGVPNQDVYGEYLPPVDYNQVQLTAAGVVAAIKSVRGQPYIAREDYFLQVGQNPQGGAYPTSGAVDDYSYSRHFADPTKARIYAFTLEFGLVAEFAPAFPEMGNIIQDIDAGLQAFCLADPCAGMRQQYNDAEDQWQTVLEALNDGEIPEPRTPANIAAVRKSISLMRVKAAALEKQVLACEAANS